MVRVPLFLAVFFIGVGALCPPPSKVSRAQTSKARATPCCGLQPGLRELDFAYYSLREGFESQLYLVGATKQPTDLTIAIYGQAGTSIVSNVTVQPSAKLAIDLRSLLAQHGADVQGEFGEGSVAVFFEGPMMGVAGQVTVTNPALHLVHESEMVENDPGRTDIPSVLNGLWWNLAPGRDARVMVANMSSSSVAADVFLDYQGQRHASALLTFNAHELKVLSVIELLGQQNTEPAGAPEGGITIIQRGAPPRLIAQGKMLDAVTGFSATMHFPSPALENASALHASGIPVGKPSKDSPFAGMGYFTPHVVVRNLLASPQTVTITLEYPQVATGNGATASTPATLDPVAAQDGKHSPATLRSPLGPVTVPAYSTQDISLAALMNRFPAPLPFCSVRIQYSGPPGSVEAQVSSIEPGGNLVVDSHAQNEGNGWAGSGANPWHLDEDTESILFLTNASEKPARIGFKVSTDSSAPYYLTKLRLNPHETRALDMRKLRDAQQPDFKNHKIPAAATDGSVMWGRLDKLRVMGHMMVVRHHQDIASDILPLCPCPFSYDPGLNYMTPETLDLQLGETLDFTFYGAFYDCNENMYYYDEDEWADWTSEYPGIATVNSSGAVTGESGGTTWVTADFSDYDYTYDSSCPETLVPGGAGGTVNVVTVSVSCTNEHLALGTGSPGAYTGTNTGTCTATPSISGGTYSWVSNKNTVSLSGNTSATVTYSSSNPSTAMGDTILTVTYTLNGQAPTASSPGITVHKPTSLAVAQNVTQDGTETLDITCAGTYACPDAYGSCPCTYGSGLCSQTGPVFIRIYAVQDQFNPPNQFDQVGISYTNNAEAFTSISTTCCADKPTPSPPANSSQFFDKFELLNTCCFSGQPGCKETIGQTITVNGFLVRTDTVTKTCTSASVTP
jgi:hypothetical protein